MSSVKLCIHRAADAIGGNCIEIVAPTGDRILLDAGRPLDTPSNEATPIPKTLDMSKPALGVLISHSHGDHYGLLSELPASWPVYCGEATEELLRLFSALGQVELKQQFRNWQNAIPLQVGPFVITPYLIDHSAFDAYALKIEVGGKTVFYSGDFRVHGRKASFTQRIIEEPPKNVDILLMEGTNLTGPGTPQKPTRRESDLEDDFVSLFRETSGRVFVSWSSSNIDRTVTLFRACKRSGRILVPDLFCMSVLMLLKKYGKIPQPDWAGAPLCAVVTDGMVNHLAERLGERDIVEQLKSDRAAMSAKRLLCNSEKWVIMARDSLVGDFRQSGLVPDQNDVWVWSQWKGYLTLDSTKKVRDYFKPCRREHIHSSGHASPEVLRRFAEAINPKMLIPMHGENWEANTMNFLNIVPSKNGQWIITP